MMRPKCRHRGRCVKRLENEPEKQQQDHDHADQSHDPDLRRKTFALDFRCGNDGGGAELNFGLGDRHRLRVGFGRNGADRGREAREKVVGDLLCAAPSISLWPIWASLPPMVALAV
jgi:hypothetical protein